MFPVEPFGCQKHRFSRVRTRGFEPPPSQLRTRSLVWRVCQFRHVRSLASHGPEFRQNLPFSQRPFLKHLLFFKYVTRLGCGSAALWFRCIVVPLDCCLPDCMADLPDRQARRCRGKTAFPLNNMGRLKNGHFGDVLCGVFLS